MATVRAFVPIGVGAGQLDLRGLLNPMEFDPQRPVVVRPKENQRAEMGDEFEMLYRRFGQIVAIVAPALVAPGPGKNRARF